jgi:hypothetical protein
MEATVSIAVIKGVFVHCVYRASLCVLEIARREVRYAVQELVQE